MPYKVTKLPNGRVRVTSPNGTKAKATSSSKAKKQVRLLQGIEHGWKPAK